jgi:hypothetical protein
MNGARLCDLPRDAGYFNACHVCGIPGDAGYFDDADITGAPSVAGEQRELARVELHPQYCGVLLYFAQHAEPVDSQQKGLLKTPGYEWMLLCNNQPRAPYLPTSLIRNPWGQNAFPIHLRLEEGTVVRFVVRKVSPPPGVAEIPLSVVGGRLQGRYWYNATYGGAPHRL